MLPAPENMYGPPLFPDLTSVTPNFRRRASGVRRPRIPCYPATLPPSAVVDLGFEGLDVGGGIGLRGGEDAGDEHFDCLLFLQILLA